MAGISGEDLLYIVDEGSGYPNEQWAAIKGNLAAEGTRMLVLGNPTIPSGPYFDAFHKDGELYNLVHISAFDTPNVIEGRVVIPGLASKRWVDDCLKEWGEDHFEYQVRVLGNFPGQGSDTVIPLAWVEEAKKRFAMLAPARNQVDIGVDVARFGDDDSVIAVRRGATAWVAERVNGFDGNAVAGRVVAVLREQTRNGEKATVRVDEIGAGAAVVDALRSMRDRREIGEHIAIFGINVSESSDDEEQYHSLRDQLWFGLRMWLKDGAIRADKALEADLLSPKYGFDARGRRQVESKEKMKKRLGRSPDAGDAFCLACHTGSARIEAPEGTYEPMSRWEGVGGAGY
jgi:hypothetical protein